MFRHPSLISHGYQSSQPNTGLAHAPVLSLAVPFLPQPATLDGSMIGNTGFNSLGSPRRTTSTRDLVCKFCFFCGTASSSECRACREGLMVAPSVVYTRSFRGSTFSPWAVRWCETARVMQYILTVEKSPRVRMYSSSSLAATD